MNVDKLKFHSCEVNPPAAERGGVLSLDPRRRFVVPRWLFAVLVVALGVTLQAAPARAQQFVDCPPEQQPLLTIPELAAQNNILRGTIVLSDQQQKMPFRQPPQSKPGDPGSLTKCSPQYVRMLRGVNASPTPTPDAGSPYPNPMPGPTLRARVGDLVQLTFINQINPGHFGASIDNGEKGFGCDKPVPPGDVFPDCFHGSSTGNIHFHGSHTNPEGTGDNVFVEVRPLPRDNQGNLTTTPEKVQKSLDEFYAQCEARLKNNALRAWPKVWADLPSEWTEQQKSLLQAYDKQLVKLYGDKAKQLWPVNAEQLRKGEWPQYYIGAFPYCYRLPEYTAKTWSWPPPGQNHMHGGAHAGGAGAQAGGAHAEHSEVRTGGAGTAELNSVGLARPEQSGVGPSLIMGQSPGTHWYHAHKHGSTAINVANGMTGAFIIEGAYDDDLNAWYGAGWTRRQPVLIMNQLGVTPNLMRGGQGQTDKGPNFSVNGQINPVINMQPGEVKMLRIVNTSGRASAFFLSPPKNASGKYTQFEWRQLAQDGVQFNNYNYQQHLNKSFLLASGNRADLLVKALPCADNAKSCTYPVLVQNEVDPSDRPTANKLTLVTINVSGDAIPPTSPRAKFMPEAPRNFPPFLADIDSSEVSGSKTITFKSTPPFANNPAPPPPVLAAQHTINGKKFDGEVGVLVQLNRVEEWKIKNETFGPAISHPFHIHINPFQVVEVFDPNETLTGKDGKPVLVGNKPVNKYVFQGGVKLLPGQCYLDPFGNPEDWKPCGPTPLNRNGIWWDVFPIPSGKKVTTSKTVIDPKTKKPVPVTVNVPGYFKMRSRFVDYSGHYVIHCHILAHEDRGMMTVVEVSPATLPYSHN
jgi:FtsP/CotA-like multicopper oxidase with cupredoxin domain